MTSSARWQPGDHIVRREVWGERVWTGLPMWVVEDSDDVLALYLPTGAPVGFASGAWPIATERHPWDVGERPVWKGHGVLHLHRPADPYCVIVFWTGPERKFSHWYVNFQAPYRRSGIGIETLDHVLDILIQPNGEWTYKDAEEIDEAVALGLYSEEEAGRVRADAERVGRMITSGDQWWSSEWAAWTPPQRMRDPRGFPDGWTERETRHRSASARGDYLTSKACATVRHCSARHQPCDTTLGEHRMRRIIGTWVAVLLSLALLAAGCGDDGGDSGTTPTDPPDDSSEGADLPEDNTGEGLEGEQLTSAGEGGDSGDLEPQYGGTLRWALNRDGTGFDTTGAVAPGSIRLINAMNDSLVGVTREGEWVPNLAESLTPSDDFLTWTITLRPGVTFHDGEPVDAAAVSANLNAFKAGPVVGFAFKPFVEAVAADELTVEVTMSEPWAAFPFSLQGQPGWMVSPETIGNNDTFVGTGPFMLENWETGTGATVVAYPDYWRDGFPYLDAIEFTFVPEQDVRRLAFEGEDVDGYNSPGDTDILDFLDDDEVDVWIGDAAGNEMAYILNTSVEPFTDVRVRRALAYAVDRQVIVDTFRSGLTIPASGPLAPDSRWYAETDYPGYDPEMAKALIDEVEAETGPISFEISSEAGASFIEVTELVMDFWRDAGVDVSIKDVALGQSAATNISGAYQAFAWIQFSSIDPDGDYTFFHSGSGPLNWSRLQNDKIDEGLDIGRTSDDPEERLRGYTLFQEGLAEDVPIVWIDHFAGIEANVARPYVHGIEEAILPDGQEAFAMVAGSFMGWGDIWIEQ